MRQFAKLFGIGISRTGTTSLTTALNTLSIDTIHWPKDMHQFCCHRGAVDITVACRFRELDQMFPGSLFIYTERSAESWISSVSAHYRALGDNVNLSLPDGQRQFAQEADIRIYGCVRPAVCDFREAYERHHASVMTYFSGQEDRLLRMNIVAGDGWLKLCQFLEVSPIVTDFPHENARRA